MNFTRRSLLSSILMALSVLLTSCGISVTNTLQLVIAAAEAALGALGQTTYLGWLKAISQAVSAAATELMSADSSAVKAEKIISAFLAIAAPILPPGTSQTIVDVIQTVLNAVAGFLASIAPAAPPPTAAAAARVTGKAVKPAAVPKQINISASDQQTLSDIKRRADSLASQIK